MSRSLYWFPFWFALVGGSVEVIALYVAKQTQPPLHLSSDFVWMAPLALMTITAATVGLFRLIALVWRPETSLALALFFSSAAVFLDLLLLVPGLGQLASGVLAAGLAVQTARAVLRHPGAVGRLLRRSTVALLVCVAAGGAVMRASLRTSSAAPVPQAVASRERPNLILITLDTVRASHLSLYGYSRATTPRLDKFAERGTVFDLAFATAPWTLPSHASMFTGRWPHELSADYGAALDARYPTLAEYLGARGYATAGFVANLKYCGAGGGLSRGFQYYQDYPRSLGEIATSSTLARKMANSFTLRAALHNDQHLDRVSGEHVNAGAMAWLSAHPNVPFFMFLNYFDAHEPYLPPPPFDRQFGRGRQRGRYSPLHHWLWNPAVAHANMGEPERVEEMDAYDGGLAFLDQHVGRLVDELGQRGILDNTVVVIAADHGEEFGEHGVYEHGYTLYRAALQVPLIVVAPGRVPAGRRVTTAVSLHDLAATIVDLLGPSEGPSFPGTSLARFWRDDRGATRDTPADALLSEVSRSPGQPAWFPSSKGDMKTVVHRGMRYIRNGDGSEELYDLTDDPWERQNVASVPERRAALEGARAALASVAGGPGTTKRN